MTSRIKKLQTISMVVILAFSFQSGVRIIATSQNDHNNTENAVKQVALEHQEVINWLNNYSLDSIELRGSNRNFWEVKLTTSNSSSSVILNVIVDQQLAEVISVSYSNAENVDTEKTIIKDAALDFFLTQPVSNYFTTNNYEIWSNFGRFNLITIKGTTVDTGKKVGFDASVSFNSTANGDLSFEMVLLKSDVSFSNIVNSTNEVEDLVKQNADFVLFLANFSSPTKTVQMIEYFDSLYYTHDIGQFFQIKYSDSTIYYLEYNQGEPTLAEGSGINTRIAISWIRILEPTYIEAELNAHTLEYTKIDGTYLATQNSIELTKSLFNRTEINTWIFNNSPFYGELDYLDGGVFGLKLASVTSYDNVFIMFNTTDNELLKIEFEVSIDANSSSMDILAMSETRSEVLEFKNANQFVNHTILYDTLGTWRVEYYNPTIDNNWLKVYINDTSQEIIDVETSVQNPAPSMSFQEIVNLALESDYQTYLLNHPDSRLLYYLSDDDFWSVFIYSPENVFNYYKIRIEDSTASILSETRFEEPSGSDSDLKTFKQLLSQNNELAEFRQEFPDAYETIYFSDKWVFYSEVMLDQMLRHYLTIEFINDGLVKPSLNTEIIGNEFIANIRGLNQDDEFIYLKNSNSKFHTPEIKEKLLSFSMSEILGGDIDIWVSATSTNPDQLDKNENFPDVLMILGISIVSFVTVFYVLKYKFQNRSVNFEN